MRVEGSEFKAWRKVRDSSMVGSGSGRRGPELCPDKVGLFIERDWYFIAEQPAPAPHLAHTEGFDAPRIQLVTVPRVSRSCEHFPDGFDLHFLHPFHKRALHEQLSDVDVFLQ